MNFSFEQLKIFVLSPRNFSYLKYFFVST